MADAKLDLNGPVCRACLKLGAKNKIFSTHKPTSQQYSYMFAYCSSIQVEPGDVLPKRICRSCVNKLVHFYKFKNIIMENDLRLREILKCKTNDTGESKIGLTEVQIHYPLVSNIDQPDVASSLSRDEDEKPKIEIKQEHDEQLDDRLEYECGSSDTFEDCMKNEENIPDDKTSEKKINQCDICDKILSCKSSLTQHLRNHTGERPHGCDLCGKKFFKAEHVVIHKRTHTGEKPYHCTLCPKKFTQEAAMKIHMRTHSGERPHMCSVCGKFFSQSGSLIYHMRTHTGETPFACNECDKRFKNSGNLNIHKRFHENVRSFQCKICERRFVTSSHLNRHLKLHKVAE